MLKVKSRGDIGCYTLGALRPLSAMDTCVDMGASITVQLGIEKALEKAGKTIKQVAVIGDSTFFHSGITGLIDVIYNQGKSTVVILDNSITAMTGHQENPGSGTTLMGEDAPQIDIVKLVRDGLGMEHTYEVDGYDVKAIRELLKREMARDGALGDRRAPALRAALPQGQVVAHGRGQGEHAPAARSACAWAARPSAPTPTASP